MTAACLPRPRPNLIPLFIILAGLALLAFVASYHAVMTHGTNALDAAHCFNHGQIMPQIMQDPLTGRMMRFCLENGRWFVSLDGCDGGNITCFPRTFAKSLSECLEYAKRAGFTHLMGILP